MQLHGNARTTPYIRREMVRRVREQAEPVTETAAALGVPSLPTWGETMEVG